MKISVITAAYNREHTIGETMRSLQGQSYRSFEHILVDGASTDGTLAMIERSLDPQCIVISEPDTGIYDALNKGISAASGEIVGILHSDDYYPDADVLARVAEKFTAEHCDIVYGDLEYVRNDASRRTIRRWRAGHFRPQSLAWGWMPPHPTVFVSRSVIEKHGAYDTSYRIAADYDAMLRYFGDSSLKFGYVPSVMMKMRWGGASNKSLTNMAIKMKEDYRSIRRNNIGGLLTLAAKNLSKAHQFL